MSSEHRLIGNPRDESRSILVPKVPPVYVCSDKANQRLINRGGLHHQVFWYGKIEIIESNLVVVEWASKFQARPYVSETLLGRYLINDSDRRRRISYQLAGLLESCILTLPNTPFKT